MPELDRFARAGAVSVRTMREFLRDRVSGAIQGMPASPMMRFIRERLVGEEGYVPRPSQLARMAVG